jgi:hypothetical protein
MRNRIRTQIPKNGSKVYEEKVDLNMSGEVEPVHDSCGLGEKGELCCHLQILSQQLCKRDPFHRSLSGFYKNKQIVNEKTQKKLVSRSSINLVRPDPNCNAAPVLISACLAYVHVQNYRV